MKSLALISVHDVTPRYEKELNNIINWLDKLEVSRTYLVIPLFHGYEVYDIRESDSFNDLLNSTKAELCLHGYTHLGSKKEFEFKDLKYNEARSRIETAKKIVKEISSTEPEGFVPPAWKINQESLRAVEDAGFTYLATGWKIINFHTKKHVRNAACTFYAGSGIQDAVYGFLSDINFKCKCLTRGLTQICIHPQDGSKKIAHEISMINYLKKHGYEFLTYKEFVAKL